MRNTKKRFFFLRKTSPTAKGIDRHTRWIEFSSECISLAKPAWHSSTSAKWTVVEAVKCTDSRSSFQVTLSISSSPLETREFLRIRLLLRRGDLSVSDPFFPSVIRSPSQILWPRNNVSQSDSGDSAGKLTEGRKRSARCSYATGHCPIYDREKRSGDHLAWLCTELWISKQRKKTSPSPEETAIYFRLPHFTVRRSMQLNFSPKWITATISTSFLNTCPSFEWVEKALPLSLSNSPLGAPRGWFLLKGDSSRTSIEVFPREWEWIGWRRQCGCPSSDPEDFRGAMVSSRTCRCDAR